MGSPWNATINRYEYQQGQLDAHLFFEGTTRNT